MEELFWRVCIFPSFYPQLANAVRLQLLWEVKFNHKSKSQEIEKKTGFISKRKTVAKRTTDSEPYNVHQSINKIFKLVCLQITLRHHGSLSNSILFHFPLLFQEGSHAILNFYKLCNLKSKWLLWQCNKIIWQDCQQCDNVNI